MQIVTGRFSRRAMFVGAMASLPAIAVAGSALAATAAETPDERAVRLANELSEAMNGFMTPAGGTPGWVAHVGPSNHPDPIWFSQDAGSAPDPLADTIAEYNTKVAEFSAIPEKQITSDEIEEAFVMATYGPASDRLCYATPPATSLRGVAEAIRYAIDQKAFIDIPAERVVKSALAYLERRYGV
ncbi:hypothetical protein [Mesorhizobium sp. M2A.F.Ca.ET.039.01.1.1]|nr:hypothetical protein [Mesorhizobium sp. M2A.F.Ca.ET.039.01.1.1]RUY10303.1 hypothetical protein EOA25_08945 [Mesorhizobium sp. M2A.F.Ca.ET.040.01.1.1]RWX65503.1 hypothetical protein EOA24_20565 [Mesorhizobium sp. M2A.F.Ca.ET.039.01.1.1]TIV18830.1 MAG: hypothetical protein E5V95_11580 [Mesorhizobium sp.]TIV47639.1 MAG: hypothetical protein E5V96_02480 [Mesorhizobium sp.]